MLRSACLNGAWCAEKGKAAGCLEAFNEKELVISGESAGWRQVFSEVLVTGDIVAQCFQRAGANARQTHKFKLEQNSAARGAGGALQAFVNHASQPTACVVFQAQQRVDHFAVFEAEVHAPNAVPTVCTQALSGGMNMPLPLRHIRRCEGKITQWPLPAHINLFTLIARQSVSGVEHTVGTGVVARGECGSGGAVRLRIKLDRKSVV